MSINSPPSPIGPPSLDDDIFERILKWLSNGMLGSPADYDISIRLGKGYHLGKNPRFQRCVSKDGTMSLELCSRLNRSSRSQLTCSTPNISSYKNTRNIRRARFDLSSAKRGFAANKMISSNQPREECQDVKNSNHGGEFFNELGNLPSTSGLVSRRASATDDSDTLTSSEELEYIFGNKKHQFRRLNNPKQTNQGEGHTILGDLVLIRISELEKHMVHIGKDLRHLHRKTDRIQEECAELVVKSRLSSENSTTFRRKVDNIVRILTSAINNLSDEFENKRKAIHRHIEANILEFLAKILADINKDTGDIRKLCESTLADLIKQVTNILDTTDVGHDKESSKFNTERATDTYFNYENSCLILSDLLQSSKDELDSLQQHKLDITLKCQENQRALEQQGSLINMLYREINNLRLDIAKKM